MLVATFPTVPYGRLFLRSFQWEVIWGIRRGRSAHRLLLLSDMTMTHLAWWSCSRNFAEGSPFVLLPHSHDFHRRFDSRLGHCVAGSVIQGFVEQTQPSYQLARTESGIGTDSTVSVGRTSSVVLAGKQ